MSGLGVLVVPPRAVVTVGTEESSLPKFPMDPTRARWGVVRVPGAPIGVSGRVCSASCSGSRLLVGSGPASLIISAPSIISFVFLFGGNCCYLCFLLGSGVGGFVEGGDDRDRRLVGGPDGVRFVENCIEGGGGELHVRDLVPDGLRQGPA